MLTESETTGLILWALIFAGAFMLRWLVSRNTRATRSTTRPAQSGPKWEQDVPYALLLDDDEDDLIFPEED